MMQWYLQISVQRQFFSQQKKCEDKKHKERKRERHTCKIFLSSDVYEISSEICCRCSRFMIMKICAIKRMMPIFYSITNAARLSLDVFCKFDSNQWFHNRICMAYLRIATNVYHFSVSPAVNANVNAIVIANPNAKC